MRIPFKYRCYACKRKFRPITGYEYLCTPCLTA